MTTSHSKKPVKKKKPIKKTKPIPANIKQRTLSIFQKLRRVEEANIDGNVRCISCGAIMNWKEAQGGHFIPRGVEVTCIERDNVNPQCPRCNGYLSGNLIQYRINLVKKIGEERVERLENMMMAEKGNEEAMNKLSYEDQINVLRKRGKVYWKERYDEFKKELKEKENE